MDQLEQRFYERSKIADITSVNPEDSKHFKRNVENTLTKWGYGFEWLRGGATITHVPTLPEERLKEILIRQFHVDIQVDMYAFACFVTAFTDVDGFSCMPWKVREKEYQKYSGKFYSGRTLSSWCKKLIEQQIMTKGSIGSYWKTYTNDDKEKIRETVSFEEAHDYFKRRSELVDSLTIDIVRANKKISYDEARREAWQDVYRILWDEFKCCYYSCKTFHFTAWNVQGDLAEVYELTRQISRKEDGHG